jgi:hypothetical protein
LEIYLNIKIKGENMNATFDSEYVEKRSKLIPFAEKYADEKNGKVYRGKDGPGREEWMRSWNLDYHSKMNELASKL